MSSMNVMRINKMHFPRIQIFCIRLTDTEKTLHPIIDLTPNPVAYPGILFGGGGSTNSVEDRGQREWGSGGGSPLVRGSGDSCNLVQEISFNIVKFS